MSGRFAVQTGRPHPLGATPDAGGTNFAVFSERATAVTLLLFDRHDSPAPIQEVVLDQRRGHRTFHLWHAYVEGVTPGYHYAYRVDGPHELGGHGDRFNPAKVLIDPSAYGNTTALWDRALACGPDDNVATCMRSVVIDLAGYDWEGDRPLNRPMKDSIVYELHVGGFTRSPSSGVRHPGTFAGIVEKIPYLRELGVTAVELMPVCQFDELEERRTGPSGPLSNYWGYSTVGFLAPHAAYCVGAHAGEHIREFRDMVKALHRAGIEVILDMVFNHTSEGNHQGPSISYRGLDNATYYHLVPGDRRYYLDYSGCGNTVNCNHPVVDRMIVTALEFWVQQMHVDGFRFDEGSILARGEDGAPLVHPPAIWHIELSPALADTKVIAEAWDAAGLYQIGYFPGYRWAEWNGKYRDVVRRFVKGDPGLVGQVASRIAGSADLYQATGHLPVNSVNFVDCHDGFTLNDLVSYNGKHNADNGEGNRDGMDDNMSWNCGAEGVTPDAGVEALRERQVRNFFAILMLSQGVPMFVAGDEVRRTQGGNNNAYCQDNRVSWFDWDLVGRRCETQRFCRELIAFRRSCCALRRDSFFTGEVNARGLADIAWHGCRLGSPGWDDPEARALAFTLGGVGEEPDLHVMLNMYWGDLDFEVPAATGRTWHRFIDTSLPPPEDVHPGGAEAPAAAGGAQRVGRRSVVVLLSRPQISQRGALR
jgi:glycogen operon protein